MVGEVEDLSLGQAQLSAPGRVDVDSRGAADAHGGAQVHQTLQPRGQLLPAHVARAEGHEAEEDCGVVAVERRGRRRAIARLAAQCPVAKPREPPLKQASQKNRHRDAWDCRIAFRISKHSMVLMSVFRGSASQQRKCGFALRPPSRRDIT